MDKVTSLPIILTVIALLAWPLVMRLLAAAVAHDRERLAVLAHELLADPHLDEHEKNVVEAMADDAMDWRALFVATWALPAYIVGRRLNLVKAIDLPEFTNPETAKKFSEFADCHMRSIAAAGPLFAIVLGLEFAIMALILVPFGMLNRLQQILLKSLIYGEHHAHNHAGH